MDSAMEIYQVFVKLLDGRSQCIQFSSPTVSGETLRRDLCAKTKIPEHLIRIVSGYREISAGTVVYASPDGFFPSMSVLLRLPGGKGGFGSLLRGAATKAGQKKTNNFDACRDMSGRRLRHVNAEKRIEEWKAEAEERKLEKLAEQFLKKKAKEVKKDSSDVVDKYLEKYKEDSSKCMGDVEESVRESFLLYKESKRKVLPASEPSSKRLRIWLGKEKMVESDSDDDDSEDENEEISRDGSGTEDDRSLVLDGVLDGGICSTENKVLGEDSSASASCRSSDGESSGVGSDEDQLGQMNEDSVPNCAVKQDSADSNSESNGTIESEKEVAQIAPDSVSSLADMPVVVEPVAKEEIDVQPVAEVKGVENAAEVVTAEKIIITSMVESLDFEKYNSATELEVLGLERLKVELQSHGLKCGGTLQERASRLFLLKTTPLEKLPKKLLAKPLGTK